LDSAAGQFAFRGLKLAPIRGLKVCPTRTADSGYARISDAEAKGIMKAAVDTVCSLLRKKEAESEAFAKSIVLGERCTQHWDGPEQ
jgi:hypothetical protein